MVTGGCPDQEGPRAPSRRSDSGGLGLPGFSRPDLAAASSQPVLLTPVSGAHGCAIAKPPESRDVWRVAEASTIETRKRGALARGEGRPPEAAGSRVAAVLASSRGLWTPRHRNVGTSVFWWLILGGQRLAFNTRRRRAGRIGLRGAAAGNWQCLGTHAGRPGRPRSQERKPQRQE